MQEGVFFLRVAAVFGENAKERLTRTSRDVDIIREHTLYRARGVNIRQRISRVFIRVTFLPIQRENGGLIETQPIDDGSNQLGVVLRYDANGISRLVRDPT